MSVLEVKNLKTWFKVGADMTAKAVDGVTFSVKEGKTLAIVGESGCGKSVTAMSILRLLSPKTCFHPDGEILFEGKNLLALSEEEMQTIRGHGIGMIFQEPMTALNPVYTIGDQIREPMIKHLGVTVEDANGRAAKLLDQMGMRNPDLILKSYPHQLSGGMRQRVVIAMAMACEPKILICDEPTTALDVTIQAQILTLIKDLQKDIGTSVVLITHDLGVVNQMADDVMVMYSGRVCEFGSREQIMRAAKHPYTHKLMQCIPRSGNRDKELPVIKGMVRPATDFPEVGCRFHERCDFAVEKCRTQTPDLYDCNEGQRVSCFQYVDGDHPISEIFGDEDKERHKVDVADTVEGPLLTLKGLKTHFPVKKGFFKRTVGHVMAVDDINLEIHQGKTLAVVGESGCGKSTLGQSILRLIKEADGSVEYDGHNVLTTEKERMKQYRKSLQIIFQDPYGSLNPRLTVRQIVGEGLRVHHPEYSRQEVNERIDSVLEEVGIAKGASDRYPHEFSGGQRQRIAIARALILHPQFIVLDEATSALDVSVQAQVLNLLRKLQAKYNLTYLFITHDIGVVSYIAHEVAVMYLGKVVEYGEAQEVLTQSKHPYTRSLVAAVPSVDYDKELPPPLEGDVPSPIERPTGCHFHPRCPKLLEGEKAGASWAKSCKENYPEISAMTQDTWTRCFAEAAERS